MRFDHRPLGFKIKEGENEQNGIIVSVDDEAADSILIGTQIMEINGVDCVNVPFNSITKWLKSVELPVGIVFQRPPREKVENWSSARVRQWWFDSLPRALHVYAGIVEECQLVGSDLFELDM